MEANGIDRKTAKSAGCTRVRARYTLTLQPTEKDHRPDAVKLRRLLKALGRRHGLRVLEVRELPAPEPQEQSDGR